MTRGQDALLIDIGAGEAISGIATRVDLRQFTLPVLLANDQEAAAHEEVLNQLDKASGGKTLWRPPTQPMA
jgi:DNA polymerase-3 subunit epsilon